MVDIGIILILILVVTVFAVLIDTFEQYEHTCRNCKHYIRTKRFQYCNDEWGRDIYKGHPKEKDFYIDLLKADILLKHKSKPKI